MKKTQQCTECNQNLPVDYYCDTCGNNLTQKRNHYIQELGKSIAVRDSSIILNFNEVGYDFCNYQCLLKFILEELKKENKQ
jgi:predicted RNA-binding Zn-ribbon protein involved in translation (DUF1610 family)